MTVPVPWLCPSHGCAPHQHQPKDSEATPKRADWDDLWLLMTLAGTWLLLWEGGGLVEIKARQFSLYSDLSLVPEAPAGAPSAVTRCQGNESGSWKSQGSSARQIGSKALPRILSLWRPIPLDLPHPFRQAFPVDKKLSYKY